GPRHALGVGAEIEAQVHGLEYRPRVAPFGLAPAIEHLALLLPLDRADVGAVPAVRVLRRRAERALLAASADPDRNARLQWLGIVGRIGDLEVLALEVRALQLGIEEHPQDLRVLLEHVLARPDRRKREAEGFRLDVVPSGAEAAIDAPVREVVDRRERFGEQ